MDRIAAKRRQILEALRASESPKVDLPVARAMTADPTCVCDTMTVLELVRVYQEKRFRHLLVNDRGGRFCGIISDRDVLPCLGLDQQLDEDRLSEIRASDIMSTDLITVGPFSPMSTAVMLMIEHGINCLPVVDDRRLVGIITNTDLQVMLDVLMHSVEITRVEPIAAS